jgi:hypothetical protein
VSSISLSLPELGQPDKTQDPKIINAFNAITAVVNGNLDAGNFAAAYKDGVVANASLRTLGTGPQQAAPGNLVIVKTWTTPSLGANWSSQVTGGQLAGYRLSTDSTMVELKGEMRNQDGSQGQGESMFTLPAGFRPAHTVRAAIPWWNGTARGCGTLEVRTNGEVVLEEGSAFGRATLDGIRFPLT